MTVAGLNISLFSRRGFIEKQKLFEISEESWSQNKSWPLVKVIARQLIDHGCMAYLAGGCVRDALLGRECSDIDIATNATPEQIEQWFPKTVAVGKSFGVIRVLSEEDATEVEVASFRSDGAYIDGRRPQSVQLSDPKMDAERRDFTINALFFDLATSRLIDHVGGLLDLQNRTLKTVGNPRDRFREDHLRILRLFRFQAQLNFQIEESTLAAAISMSQSLNSLSRERIEAEIQKATLATHFDLHCESFLEHVLVHVWPQFQQLDRKKLKLEIQERAKAWSIDKTWDLVAPELAVFSFWLLSLISISNLQVDGNSHLFSFLNSLKISRALQSKLKILMKVMDLAFWQMPREDILIEMFECKFPECLALIRFDCLKLKLADQASIESIQNDLKNFPEPFLSGSDILAFAKGPQIGQLLRLALRAQLQNKISNKQEALAYIRGQLK